MSHRGRDEMVGRRVGTYRIEALLGIGGMARCSGQMTNISTDLVAIVFDLRRDSSDVILMDLPE